MTEGKRKWYITSYPLKSRVRCLTGRGKERKQDACGDTSLPKKTLSESKAKAGTNETKLYPEQSGKK